MIIRTTKACESAAVEGPLDFFRNIGGAIRELTSKSGSDAARDVHGSVKMFNTLKKAMAKAGGKTVYAMLEDDDSKRSTVEINNGVPASKINEDTLKGFMTDKQEVDNWLKESSDARKTGSAWTDWTIEEARRLDEKFSTLNSASKSKMIDNHFPSGIKSSSAILKNALTEKRAPFQSYLFRNILNYKEKADHEDISMANANSLIANEKVLGPLLVKHGTSGLDLMKSDFQLKAIAYIANKGLDINLRKGGKWASEDVMKNNIRAHEFSEKEKEAVKNKEKQSDNKAENEATRKKLLEEATKRAPSISSQLENFSIEELKAFLETVPAGGGIR